MLALLLILSATPDAGQAPTPREMAQLFFLAGDLHRAIDAGKRCMQLEGKKKCEPFYRALVEYQALIPRNDQLTTAEAKAYLAWDKLVSPQQEGKLTAPVRRRYIEDPLAAGRRAIGQGENRAAAEFAKRVLEVDPKNEEAQALAKQAAQAPPRDAGP